MANKPKSQRPTDHKELAENAECNFCNFNKIKYLGQMALEEKRQYLLRGNE